MLALAVCQHSGQGAALLLSSCRFRSQLGAHEISWAASFLDLKRCMRTQACRSLHARKVDKLQPSVSESRKFEVDCCVLAALRVCCALVEVAVRLLALADRVADTACTTMHRQPLTAACVLKA